MQLSEICARVSAASLALSKANSRDPDDVTLVVDADELLGRLTTVRAGVMVCSGADSGKGDFLLAKIRPKRSSAFFLVDGCLSNDVFMAMLCV